MKSYKSKTGPNVPQDRSGSPSPTSSVVGEALRDDTGNLSVTSVVMEVDRVQTRKNSMENTKTSGESNNAMSRVNIVRKENPFSQEKADPAPRFLILGRTDGENFDKVSPFLISKTLFGLIGNLKSIKKIKEGLLIETVSELQSRKLQDIQRLGTFRVEVKPHRSLNFSKGVVTCRDFLNCPLQEILDELSGQGVIEVKRMLKRRNGELVETPNHILTFNKPNLPSSIKAAFYSLTIRPYIPNPIRCFKCLQFGHISSTCANQEMCVCGEPLHEGVACNESPHCINCKGQHSSRSNNCPKYKEEVNIQNIRTLERVTYIEAKRKYLATIPSTTTYSLATTSTSKQYTDTKRVVEELLPNITKIIENQVKKSMELFKNNMNIQPPKFKIPVVGPYRSQEIRKAPIVSEISSHQPESRKRTISHSQDEEILFSDESSASQFTDDAEITKKTKTKGWPKGKPRKPPPPKGLLPREGTET